jgi:hypothetical protein
MNLAQGREQVRRGDDWRAKLTGELLASARSAQLLGGCLTGNGTAPNFRAHMGHWKNTPHGRGTGYTREMFKRRLMHIQLGREWKLEKLAAAAAAAIPAAAKIVKASPSKKPWVIAGALVAAAAGAGVLWWIGRPKDSPEAASPIT